MRNIGDYNFQSFGDQIAESLLQEILAIKQELSSEDLNAEEEDMLFIRHGYQPVNQLLTAAQAKLNRLIELNKHINSSTVTNDVFLPPSENQKRISPGDGENTLSFTFEPRLETILSMLENNDIEVEELPITVGNRNDNMMRTQPYVLIEVPELNIYIIECNEIGNALFVIKDLREKEILDILLRDKDEIRAMVESGEILGIRLVHSKGWLDTLQTYLFTSNNSRSHSNYYNNYDEQDEDISLYFGEILGTTTLADEIIEENGKQFITRKGLLILFPAFSSTSILPRIREIPGTFKQGNYYYYPLMESYSALKQIIDAPRASSEGEWRGFYQDMNGKHWGARTLISEKLGMVLTQQEVEGLNTMEIMFQNLSYKTAFCFEDVKERFKDFLSLPQVDENGSLISNGKIYHTLPSLERHEGLQILLGKNGGQVRSTVTNAVGKHPEDFSDKIPVRGISGKPATAYSIDQIIDYFNNYNAEIPEGYVTVETLAAILDLDPLNIARVVTQIQTHYKKYNLDMGDHILLIKVQGKPTDVRYLSPFIQEIVRIYRNPNHPGYMSLREFNLLKKDSGYSPELLKKFNTRMNNRYTDSKFYYGTFYGEIKDKSDLDQPYTTVYTIELLEQVLQEVENTES